MLGRHKNKGQKHHKGARSGTGVALSSLGLSDSASTCWSGQVQEAVCLSRCSRTALANHRKKCGRSRSAVESVHATVPNTATHLRTNPSRQCCAAAARGKNHGFRSIGSLALGVALACVDHREV